MALRKRTAAQELGLTLDDVDAILAARSMIPWPISYDRGEQGELYAIIHPPRNYGVCAFLLDREDGQLVLTDNLSDPLGVVVTDYPDVGAAATHVSRILSQP